MGAVAVLGVTGVIVGAVGVIVVAALVGALVQAVRTKRTAEALLGTVLAARDERPRIDHETEPLVRALTQELRGPLRVVVEFAETMVTTNLSPENAKVAAGAVRRGAVELATILDRADVTAAVDEGVFGLTCGPVDLASLVYARTAAIEMATGREVRVDVGDPPPPSGDDTAVEIAITHLLDNAVRYSAETEPVRVEAGYDDETVWFSVGDTGIGLDRAQCLCCFERAWQAEAVDAHRLGGAGMGLYVVRTLVEAMGGSVSVDSELGRGSVFTVLLPRAEVPALPGGDAGPRALENPA